jgi:hypothetical protein
MQKPVGRTESLQENYFCLKYTGNVSQLTMSLQNNFQKILKMKILEKQIPFDI